MQNLTRFKQKIKSFKSRAPLLGLDIGHSSIKLLELDRVDNRFCLKKYYCNEIQPGIVVESAVVNPVALTGLLTDLVDKLNIKNRNVAIAIPENAVISKTIHLNANFTADEIAEHLSLNLENYFSHTETDLYFDFEILGESAQVLGQLDVLIVVAHKKIVDGYLNAVRASGLNVKIIDTQSLAIERAIKLNFGDETIAIIDIGCQTLLLMVMQKGKIIYSFSDANSKKEFSKENIAIIIQSLLQTLYSSHEIEITTVYVLGGIIKPDLIPYLRQQFGMQFILPNLFVSLQVDDCIDKFNFINNSSRLVISYGLALRGYINYATN